MPFHLRISFSGICGFVPNRDFSGSPTKVCAVLPNGEGDAPFSKRSLDGTQLLRHRAFLRFKLNNLKGAPVVSADRIGIWYLKRQHVTFQATGDPNPLTIGSVAEAADVTRVAPDFAVVDPDTITGNSTKVTARVMIQEGRLETDQLDGPWRTPNTLSNTPHLSFVRFPTLAQVIRLTYLNLTSFQVVAMPLDGGDLQAPLELQGADGEWVDISILNLCDANPLQWDPKLQSTPDADFKWYFELLPDFTRETLAKILSGLELPILVPESQPDGRGINCFPALLGQLAF